MEENGVVRTQGSVYESVEPIKITDTRNIIYNMTKELPWVTKAMTACSYTSIGIKHNGMEINSACLPKSQKEYEGPRLINGALGFFRMFGMLY